MILLKNIVIKIAAIIVVVLLIVGGFYATKNNMFGLNFGLFGNGSVKIEETANIVEQVKKISEFTTACYYEEYVIKNKRIKNILHENKFNKSLNVANGEIAIITKATVRAGYNLGKLSQEDLRLNNDTLYIKLPTPEVFDVVMNPSDYEIFVEEGKWTHDEVTTLQISARDSILSNAITSGLLEKANTIGVERIKSLFQTFGFDEVKVE